MIKDPLHQEETPYDLLGLDPNASYNEIHQALPRFIRKNISKIGRAQEAAKRLRNPRDRIAIDILYYCIGKMDEEDIGEVDLNSALHKFLTVPYLKDEELYSDLKKEDFLSDFREIKFSKFKISELKKYDDIENLKLEIPFDR